MHLASDAERTAQRVRAPWLHSYVTSDKVYCVCIAEDEVAVRGYADRVGVPVSAVHEITSVFDPTTGE